MFRLLILVGGCEIDCGWIAESLYHRLGTTVNAESSSVYKEHADMAKVPYATELQTR